MENINFEIDRKETTIECPKHGIVAVNKMAILGKEIESKCPSCIKEMQAQEDEKERVLELEREKIALDRQKAFYIENSGVPLRFKSKGFGDFEAANKDLKNSKQKAIDYVKNFENALKNGQSGIFYGSVGGGKTHLACAVANNLLEKGYNVKFVSFIDLLRKIKETYSKKSESGEKQAVLTFITPQLLIVDEIGIQFGTDYEKTIFFDIINKRYELMKPTIIISNLPVSKKDTAGESIESMLTERTLDRLLENDGLKLKFEVQKSFRNKN